MSAAGAGAAGARHPVLTVGHSTRALVEFLELLDENSATLLVDVRKLPGSARYPQFDAGALRGSLRQRGKDYVRLDALTGRRPVSRTVPFEVNGWWENRSFHNYADHALSADFGAALAELRRLSAERRTVLMCSEAVWWRCHRRIVADHLLAGGTPVRHILGAGRVEEATLSAGASVAEDGQVTYPAFSGYPSPRRRRTVEP